MAAISRTKAYKVWQAMFTRAARSKYDVKVCDEWQTFEGFKDWLLQECGCDDFTAFEGGVKMIDKTKGFTPDNCKVTEPKQKRIKALGTEFSVKDWAEVSGLSEPTIYRRLKSGKISVDELTKRHRAVKGAE